MTNKTTSKAKPSPETLKAAYEIHTLTQMIYGELAATRPWLAQPAPMSGAAPPWWGRGW